MFLEPTLLSSAPFVLTTFLVFLAAFHAAFVWLWPVSDIGWKRIDYIWLAVAGLTLLSAVSSDRHLENRDAFEFSQGYWEQLNRAISEDVHEDMQYSCGTKFVRSEYSPNNFDEVVQQFAQACAWYQNAAKKIDAELHRANANLRPETITDDPTITNPVLRQNISALYRLLREQASVNDRRMRWRAMANDDEWDISRVRLAPILLAFALALRLTKVTGEIRLAKKRQAAKI